MDNCIRTFANGRTVEYCDFDMLGFLPCYPLVGGPGDGAFGVFDTHDPDTRATWPVGRSRDAVYLFNGFQYVFWGYDKIAETDETPICVVPNCKMPCAVGRVCPIHYFEIPEAVRAAMSQALRESAHAYNRLLANVVVPLFVDSHKPEPID